jgi:hypothetical protein
MSAMNDTYGPLPSYITPDPSVQPISMPQWTPDQIFQDPTVQPIQGPNQPDQIFQDPTVQQIQGPNSLTSTQLTGTDMLSQILRSLGLQGSTGNTNWMGVLGALAPLLAGGLSYGATNRATQQTVDAIKNAENTISGVYKANSGLYTPFINAGPGAIQGLQGMVGSNLASHFSPLGTGRGITLGQLAGH